MNETNEQKIPAEEKREAQENPKLRGLRYELGESPNEMLPKMEMNEFLELEQNNRLYYLTGNTEVAEGKNLTVDFGANKTLEREITAGHILPPEVRTITIEDERQGTLVGERQGLKGEFFAENGQRIKIYTGTSVAIESIASDEEIESKKKEVSEKVNTFDDDKQPIARAALERGVDPKFVIEAKDQLGKGYDSALGDEQKIEMIITEVGRSIGRFNELQNRSGEKEKSVYRDDGSYAPEFLAYALITNSDSDTYQDIANRLGYDKQEVDQGQNYYYSEMTAGADVQAVKIAELDNTIFENQEAQLDIPKYEPGSVDAVLLFRDAAIQAGLPKEWAKSRALHQILSKESGGLVGRPNYTFNKAFETGKDPEKSTYVSSHKEVWKEIHQSIRNNANKGGEVVINGQHIVSSATGLGQLLQANVDAYYPSGREGIGNPLEEATGMLRYIKDRYGSPEIALANYGVNHEGY